MFLGLMELSVVEILRDLSNYRNKRLLQDDEQDVRRGEDNAGCVFRSPTGYAF